MNKFKKVGEVYKELRCAFGDTLTASEVLRLASKLVDASIPHPISDPTTAITLQPAIDQVPLDEAFADGGWRIMAHERRWRTDTDAYDEARRWGYIARFKKVGLAA